MTNKFIPPYTTTANRTSSTPLDGELFYDTDEKNLYLGDGTTTGGKKVQTGGAVADNLFRIQDNTDATKQIAFEASGITTGTTRTFTVPNASGTIALTSDLLTLVSTKTTTYTANNKEEIPCNTITTGAFTITTPASGEFAVFDVGGTTPTTGFGVNNLTITPASGTIMGTTSYVLDVGAVRRRFVLVGTDWRVA